MLFGKEDLSIILKGSICYFEKFDRIVARNKSRIENAIKTFLSEVCVCGVSNYDIYQYNELDSENNVLNNSLVDNDTNNEYKEKLVKLSDITENKSDNNDVVVLSNQVKDSNINSNNEQQEYEEDDKNNKIY